MMVLAMLAGCGFSEDAPAGDAAVTVTDMRGKTHTFDEPIERVVTLPKPMASLFIAVDGGTDRLVGMNPEAKTAVESGVLGEFFPDAADISDDVSGANWVPNVESILELDPDVVVQWGERGDELIEPLEQAGIPVIAMVNRGDQEYLEEALGIFGDLTGKQDKADEIIERFGKAQKEVSSTVKGAEKHRMLYLGKNDGKYSTANSDSYFTYSMGIAGITNVAADLDNAESVGVEQILTWDPDTVVLGNWDETTPEDIYDDPVLREMSAVKNKRVYQLPLGGYRWDTGSQESALSWPWLGQIAHPDLEWGDLRAEISDWYEFLYGTQITEDQLDDVLQLELNSESVGNDTFED